MARTRDSFFRFELRAEDQAPGNGRTLIGRAVPFDEELEVFDYWAWDDYTEVFRKGAFAKTLKDRAKPVPLLDHHQRREIAIGVGLEAEWEERDDGLWGAFEMLDDSPRADEVLAAVRKNVTSGLSIGFEPIKDATTYRKDRDPAAEFDLVERLEVRLHEVSICNFPAYESAGVMAIRSARAASRSAAEASRDRHPSISALAAQRAELEGVRSAALDRWGRVQRRA